MSKVQMLRSLVKQRLTAAAEEIFGLFERTIAEYEEELCRSKEENHRQRHLLDAVFNPQVHLQAADVSQMSPLKADVSCEQPLWNSALDLDETNASHIKEELEELWISPDGQQLPDPEEDTVTEFTFTHVPVKSDENLQASRLRQRRTNQSREAELQVHSDEREKRQCERENRGGPEPDPNPDPDPEVVSDDDTLGSAENQSLEWQETGSKTLQRDQDPFSCFDYGERYFDRSSMNDSLTEEKPFRCPECRRGFSKKSNLSLHIKTHNPQRGTQSSWGDHPEPQLEEKPLSCSQCNKSFLFRRALQRHLRTHAAEKHFRCSVCGKKFKLSSNLILHEKKHTGSKSCFCPVCSKGFTIKANLRRHMALHTGEKPFSCSACGKGFSRKDHLKWHKCVDASGSGNAFVFAS